MSDQFPADVTQTAVIPTVQTAGPMAPTRRPPIPVPPEFGPRVRPSSPPPLRIHPVQWQEHLDQLEQLGKVLRALFALVAVVLILLGYVTLEAAQIVSSIHSLAAVRASIGI